MITSNTNSLVKLTLGLHSKKGRQETGLFLAEGNHLVEEALRAGAKIEQYFWTAKIGSTSEGNALLNRLRNLCPGDEVSEAVFGKMSETESPQGILAWVKIPKEGALDLTRIKLGLILDSLQDPGNMGTIIRTAWAAGVDGLFCTQNTADPYQGKVVRASMGGIFYQSLYRNVLPEQLARQAQEAEIQIVTGEPDATIPYFECDYSGPTLLVLGNEGRGLMVDWSKFPVRKVNIPQPGRAESLNVAVSAGILIYEVVRQRYVKLL